jgi:hypothetical protein
VEERGQPADDDVGRGDACRHLEEAAPADRRAGRGVFNTRANVLLVRHVQ